MWVGGRCLLSLPFECPWSTSPSGCLYAVSPYLGSVDSGCMLSLFLLALSWPAWLAVFCLFLPWVRGPPRVSLPFCLSRGSAVRRPLAVCCLPSFPGVRGPPLGCLLSPLLSFPLCLFPILFSMCLSAQPFYDDGADMYGGFSRLLSTPMRLCHAESNNQGSSTLLFGGR